MQSLAEDGPERPAPEKAKPRSSPTDFASELPAGAVGRLSSAVKPGGHADSLRRESLPVVRRLMESLASTNKRAFGSKRDHRRCGQPRWGLLADQPAEVVKAPLVGRRLLALVSGPLLFEFCPLHDPPVIRGRRGSTQVWKPCEWRRRALSIASASFDFRFPNSMGSQESMSRRIPQYNPSLQPAGRGRPRSGKSLTVGRHYDQNALGYRDQS